MCSLARYRPTPPLLFIMLRLVVRTEVKVYIFMRYIDADHNTTFYATVHYFAGVLPLGLKRCFNLRVFTSITWYNDVDKQASGHSQVHGHGPTNIKLMLLCITNRNRRPDTDGSPILYPNCRLTCLSIIYWCV